MTQCGVEGTEAAWPDTLPLHWLNGDGGRLARQLQAETVELYVIGASVSAQRGGWPVQLQARLQQLTGRPHGLRLNAMGGVGLLFGLAHHAPHPRERVPRIAFIEFSTGDLNLGLTPLDRLVPWLEELVARLATCATRSTPAPKHMPPTCRPACGQWATHRPAKRRVLRPHSQLTRREQWLPTTPPCREHCPWPSTAIL
jgi:hypothetical protein